MVSWRDVLNGIFILIRECMVIFTWFRLLPFGTIFVWSDIQAHSYRPNRRIWRIKTISDSIIIQLQYQAYCNPMKIHLYNGWYCVGAYALAFVVKISWRITGIIIIGKTLTSLYMTKFGHRPLKRKSREAPPRLTLFNPQDKKRLHLLMNLLPDKLGGGKVRFEV